MGPSLEGGRGRRRGEQHIHRLERGIKIAADQGAHLLGFLVVRIDISSGQGIGTDQDPPLDLFTKAFSPTARRHRGQTLRIRSPEAVLHAVVTSQIGRCL